MAAAGAMPTGASVMKVSKTSASKNVAGAVAHTCRAGDAPALLTAGALATNTAVKAIAIARDYTVDDQIDLRCTPELREKESSSYLLTLTKSKRVAHDATAELIELKVNHHRPRALRRLCHR